MPLDEGDEGVFERGSDLGRTSRAGLDLRRCAQRQHLARGEDGEPIAVLRLWSMALLPCMAYCAQTTRCKNSRRHPWHVLATHYCSSYSPLTDLYPFLPYEKGVAGGERFTVFDIPGVGRIGLIVCYDMWFPETVRQLTWMGAEAIICPSLTNTVDREVELAIARSNAATNQVYFLNLNSAGRLAVGQSILVGPDGQVMHQAGVGREIIALEMDFDHVRRVRERGMFGLCQTIKSFRDHPLDYPVYRDAQSDPGAYADLGELRVPERQPWPEDP